MLVFISLPGSGVLIYVLFGRGRKAFSKQSELLRQDLRASALPLLPPILSRQDAEIARLELESASRRKLMRLVRRCRRRKGLERGGRVAPAQLPHGGPSAPGPALVAQGSGRVGPLLAHHGHPDRPFRSELAAGRDLPLHPPSRRWWPTPTGWSGWDGSSGGLSAPLPRWSGRCRPTRAGPRAPAAVGAPKTRGRSRSRRPSSRGSCRG